jgi:hypothetical protein
MSAWADKSEQIDALAASLVKALGEMHDLTKSQTANAGQYAYSYATLADALQMARPVLSSNGLAITQTAETTIDEVVIWTTVLHSSGQFVTGQPLRLPAGKTAQQTGSALSYGKRYSLMAMLGLATEDDDGATAAPRVQREAPVSPSKPSKPQTGTITPKPAEARTQAEGDIRAMIATLTKTEQADLVGDFRETFGATLKDLDADMHEVAKRYVEEWVGTK